MVQPEVMTQRDSMKKEITYWLVLLTQYIHKAAQTPLNPACSQIARWSTKEKKETHVRKTAGMLMSGFGCHAVKSRIVAGSY